MTKPKKHGLKKSARRFMNKVINPDVVHIIDDLHRERKRKYNFTHIKEEDDESTTIFNNGE